ncbi:MAG: metal ABC transporter permease [Phycisphaerae bacterium]|nr:metal ABC transporter permease [Phycisphaerae bacterium]
MSLAAPGWQSLLEALSLRGGHNTTLVVLGTSLLGIAGGLAGSFALLRKRSLFVDALGHATLPGICIAFLVAPLLGLPARSLPVLLVGAALAAFVATLLVQSILRFTRLSDDAAIGAVLSVLFGVGVVLLSVIQTLPSGDQGGLKSFLFGQTAAMQRGDAVLLASIAAITAVASIVLMKEFALVAFDESFARATGLPTGRLDLALLALIVAVTVAGLQAVGLVLVIAIAVIPPVTARLWTDRVRRFVPLAAAFGGVAGWIGSSISSVAPRQPAGALIVLTSTALFVISLAVAPRGLAPAIMRRLRVRAAMARDHVLKHLLARPARSHDLAVALGHATLPTALHARLLSWRGLLRSTGEGWTLTEAGRIAGERVARNHRLWAAYLVSNADVAPDHVDPSAETIEHVLGDDLVRELEASLRGKVDA